MGHEEFYRINEERKKNGWTIRESKKFDCGDCQVARSQEASQRELKIVVYGMGAIEPEDRFSPV